MKNPAIIAVTSAITVAGGVIIYLSQTVIKYNNIKSECIHLDQHMSAYPYTNVDIPSDFKEFSVNGISFKAPAMLSSSEYDEKISIFTDDPDKNNASLQIVVFDVTTPTYPQGYNIDKEDFFSSCMKEGMDKLGYDIPENFYDLMCLLNTINLEDCNKYSPAEVRTFKKLAEFKEIMTPAQIGYGDTSTDYEIEGPLYYFDNNNTRFFVTQQRSQNGMYKLQLECYADSDLNKYQIMLIQGKNEDTVRQIARTVTKTES
jgi:hypothetical protein